MVRLLQLSWQITLIQMGTPTADSLMDLERMIEADIIECLDILIQGRAEALRELRASLTAAGDSGKAAEERLRSTTSASLAPVEAVQRELGALNLTLNDFLLTNAPSIESLAAFDSWRDRVLGAIHDAKMAIGTLGAEHDDVWGTDLENAWRRFHQRLEIVRVHLEIDETRAADEFALQRKALLDRVAQLREQMARNPKQVRDQLHRLGTGEDTSADTRRLRGWIKALWMWRENGQQ